MNGNYGRHYGQGSSNNGKNFAYAMYREDMKAVGFIDKQVIHLADAWYVEYRYDYRAEEHNRYHLRNLLKGVDQNITREQAQTPEQIAESSWWYTISDAQAKELAITLGLAS